MRLDMWLNFPKFKNSTKQPVSDPDYTLNIDLKGDDSILSPILKLQGVPSTCVYAHIHELGRYYFVKDARWLTNDIVEYSLEVDPLASHKAIIGASTQFIERSSNSYDKFIVDTNVSATQRFAYKSVREYPLDWAFTSDGCYLVRTISQSSGSATGINTYAVEKDDLMYILNYAFDYSHFGNDFQNAIVKSVFNPFDYIIDVKWVPFTAYEMARINDDTHTIKQNIKLGYWEIDMGGNGQGYPVGSSRKILVKNIDLTTLNFHYDDFRRFTKRFTYIQMFLPGYGLIDIEPEFLNETTLTVSYSFDVPTGQTRIYLSNPGAGMFATYTGSLSAQLQLAQTSNDLSRIGSDIVGVAGSAMAGNVLATTSSLVDAVMTTFKPMSSINGNPGTVSAIKDFMSIYIYIKEFDSTDVPIFNCGRPLFEYRQISTIPGYIKCGNASLSISCTDTERETINNYLNGGFYYE